MKKLLIIIALSLGLSAYGQDSTNIMVGVTLQWRDVHFLGSFIYANDDLYGDLCDTVASKIRGQADPTESNTVVINATIGTWLAVDQYLRADIVALSTSNGNNSRWKKVSDALRLLTTQTYLIRTLTERDAADLAADQARKQYGKFKNRRQ